MLSKTRGKKTPLSNPSKTLQNPSNLSAKSLKPSAPIYRKNRSFFNQSTAKTWPPSIGLGLASPRQSPSAQIQLKSVMGKATTIHGSVHTAGFRNYTSTPNKFQDCIWAFSMKPLSFQIIPLRPISSKFLFHP